MTNEEVIIQLLTEISHKLDIVCREVGSSKREVKSAIYRCTRSEYENKPTPRTEARQRQINAVRQHMIDARNNGGNPSVMDACKTTWTRMRGGYPTWQSLYAYCHMHSELF